METKQLNDVQATINEKLAKINGTKTLAELESEQTNLALKIGDITTFLESY